MGQDPYVRRMIADALKASRSFPIFHCRLLGQVFKVPVVIVADATGTLCHSASKANMSCIEFSILYSNSRAIVETNRQ